MFDFSTLQAMWTGGSGGYQAPGQATDWRDRPRTQIYFCHGPVCRGEIQGTGKVPDHYTAFTCWFCDSDEYTKPRPVERATEEAPS